MAIFEKDLFSESTLGEPIQVTATTSPGTLIHNLVDGYTSMDEVWLYASNTSSSDVVLTIELGNTGSENSVHEIVLADKSSLVIPGVPMQGDGRVRAYAATGDVINVFGWINQIII